MKDSVREDRFFNNALVRGTDAPLRGDIRGTMLNRNKHFAEIQADALVVTRITELAPLDHEEAYSVNRRQSQTRYACFCAEGTEEG